jgi:hypothetical protein
MCTSLIPMLTLRSQGGEERGMGVGSGSARGVGGGVRGGDEVVGEGGGRGYCACEGWRRKDNPNNIGH